MIIKRKSHPNEYGIDELQKEIKDLEKQRERIKSHQPDYPDDKSFRLDLKYIDEDLEDLRAELGYLQAKGNTL